MSESPGSTFVRTVYDGKAFVPSEPIDLPVGTKLDGVIKRPLSQEEWHALLDQVQGAWGDYDFIEPEELPYEPEEPLD